ncbi:MAG: hypothetical protein ACTSUJ_05200 [Candidatus Njordarchaeales archaeon]
MPSVELRIMLFDKPAWEIADFEGEELGVEFAERLKALSDELRRRLYEVARVHELLVRNS